MIEIRYDENREVDEVVAEGCTVHLERLDSHLFCLVIEDGRTRAMLNVGTPDRFRRKVNASVYCIEPICGDADSLEAGHGNR